MRRISIILAAAFCAGALFVSMTACSNNSGTSSVSVTRVAVSDTSGESAVSAAAPSTVEPSAAAPSTVEPSAAAPSTIEPSAAADPSSEVVGTWRMNLDFSAIPEENREMYRQMFDTSVSSLTLYADGTFSWTIHQTATGTWSMVGNIVYLTTSEGQTESYRYEDGKLIGIESYVLYFTR